MEIQQIWRERVVNSLGRVFPREVRLLVSPSAVPVVAPLEVPPMWVVERMDNAQVCSPQARPVLVACTGEEIICGKAVDFLVAQEGDTLAVVIVDNERRLGELRHSLESTAFEAGFRKHPQYYVAVDYESLQSENYFALVLLERLPQSAFEAYPMVSFRAQRDLHTDMLREPGERSDGHIVRYHLAANLVRAGDRVLDAACGLGYGSYVIAALTRCASVLGMDGSEYAVNYATCNFSCVDDRLTFARGFLPDSLANLPGESFDVIVSFETLEYIENPDGLLAEFSRLLRPGGQIIVGVPNDWSDEAGRNSNPLQLHTYTLESLQLLFSRHFVGETLHQQIASGCKSTVAENRWAPMPRTLREIPVDTDLVPDSEWWILSGCKPPLSQNIDFSHIGWAGRRPGWERPAEGECLAEGVVLAVHCVPDSVAPQVEKFWVKLARMLGELGQPLILLSTTPVSHPDLSVIEIPFEMTGMAERFGRWPSNGNPPDECDVMDVLRWYGCDYTTARDNLAVAQTFFRELFDTLKPSSVIGWQSVNPVTRLIRRTAQRSDVPYWNAERGWVNDTVMLDRGENNFLSEINTSVIADRVRSSYEPTSSLLEMLELRARDAAGLARYKSPDIQGREAFRQQLGIPARARVFAFFAHGEPALNALNTATIRSLHNISDDLVFKRLHDVAQELQTRNEWLLVQEHPFNRGQGRLDKLTAFPNVRLVAEHVNTVLDVSDGWLFTQATLQFDAVFLDKPFGLLSRSALYRDGVPPFIGDYATAGKFLDDLVDNTKWQKRQILLRRDVAFLFEYFLFDVKPETVVESARRCAALLGRLKRPLDLGFSKRVENFLSYWGG